jgi:hypothetical protein
MATQILKFAETQLNLVQAIVTESWFYSSPFQILMVLFLQVVTEFSILQRWKCC